MTIVERRAHMERQESRLLALSDRVVEIRENRGSIAQNRERIEQNEKRFTALMERMDARMAQNERHIAAVQDLWVRLCKRNGWLEDEDLLGG